MGKDQHRTIILEVKPVGEKWQASIKARLWTTFFALSNTKGGAITSANNFIRTHGLKPANKNRVSLQHYNIEEY